MKRKYDTVAICNALVDIEIKVTEDEFKKLPYPKGSMTLVNNQESNAVLEKFKNKSKRINSGGSVGNTVYAMAKLGRKAAVIVNVGNDEYGKKYQQSYQRVGVDFFGKKWDKPTGKCLVLITPDTVRTMVTTLGCASNFTEELLEMVYSVSSKSIYLESYLLAGDKNIKLLTQMVTRLKKRGRKVILSDSDWFGIKRAPTIYSRLFRQVDIFFSNADQFRGMCGFQFDDTMDVEKQFYRYVAMKKRPQLLVVTHSDQGAYLSKVGRGKARHVHIPAQKVKVVDTNGAGDGFAAGVLTEYFQGSSITRMGKKGTEIAARIISRFGARY